MNEPARVEPRGQQRRMQLLPVSLPPLGLCREQAAAYIGISPTLFDTAVLDGRMPAAKSLNRRKLWDRRALDLAFAALPDSADAGGRGGLDDDADNPWGDG